MKKERREARNLILILSSASCIAFLVVVGLVYYFGSSGTFLLRNEMISPEALERISFSEIEFTRAGKEKKNWGHFKVSMSAYRAFYKLVFSERSIPVLTDAMIAQFNSIRPSTLTILVRSRDNEEADCKEKILQEIQFVDSEGLFRIRFFSPQALEEWIYFRYPGIYEHVLELFALTQNKL